MESKYLEQFKKVNTKLLPIRGDRLLIEVLPREEIKSKGGLIIQASLSDHKTLTELHRGELAVVLAVGTGYFDDEGKDVPIDLAVGSVVLVPPTALEFYSKFPGFADFSGKSIAMVRDSSIIASWDSMEHYEKYKETINS